LRERDERAARKAAKKARKAQQTEAAAIQNIQTPVAGPISTQNSQFYPQNQMHSSSASPLLPGPDFTNVMHSSPAAPVFQGSNIMFPAQNSVGDWNQNQYIGHQNSPGSNLNDIRPSNWTQNQHHVTHSSPLTSVSNLNLPGNQNVSGNGIEHLILFS
jgi:hypothetical protein